jgi:uncharacterized protein (DUF1778 family)
MARKPTGLPPKDNKITFLMTQAERDRLDRAVAKDGRTVSNFIRQAVMERVDKILGSKK